MEGDQMYFIMSLAVLAGMLSALAVAAITMRKKEEEPKFVTVVKCPSCGYEEKRDWKEGDFVGLVQGPCPKCGAHMKVWSIYKVGGEEEKAKEGL